VPCGIAGDQRLWGQEKDPASAPFWRGLAEYRSFALVTKAATVAYRLHRAGRSRQRVALVAV